MSYCYHPLKGFYLGDKFNGKRKFKVVPYNVHHLEKLNGEWRKCYDDFLSGAPAITRFIDIPCGQCIGCRLQRSREWANRLMLELQSYEDAIFLTLTYDDDHLPFADGFSPLTGEALRTPTLVKEHLTKFIKDLRNRFRGKKIRYFVCGEYGDKSLRPHYHLIIFGFRPDDAKFYKVSGEYIYTTSDFISELWPYGFNVCAEVTWESCAYTARYILKKLTGPQSDLYDSLGIVPPYVCMSTRPGIGHDYYMDHLDMFDDSRFAYLSTKKGSIQFSKPRYFKKLDDLSSFIPLSPETYVSMANEHQSDFSQIVDDQVMADRVASLSTDLNHIEQLAAAEKNKLAHIKSLKRKEI